MNAAYRPTDYPPGAVGREVYVMVRLADADGLWHVGMVGGAQFSTHDWYEAASLAVDLFVDGAPAP